MGAPVVTVEVAFGASPLDPNPTWTELEQTDVLAYSDSMGRRSETDTATAPATATVTLDNGARLYDPAYTAGVYFGQLRPHLQVRVKGTVGATVRVLFLGVITDEGWQQVEARPPASLRCRLVLTDQFGHLGRRDFVRPLFETALDAVGATFATHSVRHWALDDQGPAPYAAESFTPDTTDGIASEREAPVGASGYSAVADNAQPASTVLTGPALRAGRAVSLPTSTAWALLEVPVGWGTPAGQDRAFGFAFRLLAPVGRRTRLVRPFLNTALPDHGYFVDPDGTLSMSMDDGGSVRTADAPLELGRTYFVADQWDASTGFGSLWIDGVIQNGGAIGFVGTVTSTLLTLGASNDTEPPLVAAIADVWAIDELLTADQHLALAEMWRGTAGLKTDRAADLVLEAAGVTAAVSTTNSGRVSVVATADAALSPSSMLQALERTEQGRLYFDHRSTSPGAKFLTREQFATSARQTTAQYVLSDQSADTTALRYSAPAIGARAQATRATVSNPAATATVEDRAATALVGVTAVSVSTLAEPASDAAALAETLLAEAGAVQVVRSVRVQPTDDTRAVDALSVRLFDRVELRRQPLGIGALDTTDYIVEGISTDIGAGNGVWSVGLVLSPAIDPADRWAWDVDEFTTSSEAGRLTS